MLLVKKYSLKLFFCHYYEKIPDIDRKRSVTVLNMFKGRCHLFSIAMLQWRWSCLFILLSPTNWFVNLKTVLHKKILPISFLYSNLFSGILEIKPIVFDYIDICFYYLSHLFGLVNNSSFDYKSKSSSSSELPLVSGPGLHF